MSGLLDRLLDGDHRALARAITKIENRMPGHRDLVSSLYDHTGNAEVIGITGSPGAGKSTLVDKVAEHYRSQASPSVSSPSTPPRPLLAVRCSAIASEWPRTSATWTSSSAR